MQDAYVGDIGDFGKYGMLRNLNKTPLTLAVNWYKVTPMTITKQNDGKYIDYLLKPNQYRFFDPTLFDELYSIVIVHKKRTIESIENSGLINAEFFSDVISAKRNEWHKAALHRTKGADIVFLDPDNGLETEKMHYGGSSTEKHVKWKEIKDYYDRGQSVILYQHRPQMVKKDDCIKSLLTFAKNYLLSDDVHILEFPAYTNRFYSFFMHEHHNLHIKQLCDLMAKEWCGLCNYILQE